MMPSPSMEIPEGSASTTEKNRQVLAQGAAGGRGGDVFDSTILGEAIGGGNQSVRDNDRQRDQERVAVATKFEQPMAIFEGWVRIDGTMTGSKATVHESGLFPVEIAIPLTELQGAREHQEDLPPTFTRDFTTGFVDDPTRTPAPPSVRNTPVIPEVEGPPASPVHVPSPTPVVAPRPTTPESLAKQLLKRMRPVIDTSPLGSRPSSPGPSRVTSPVADPRLDPAAIELTDSPASSAPSSPRGDSPLAGTSRSRERVSSPTLGRSPVGSRSSSPAPRERSVRQPTSDSTAPLLPVRRETPDSPTRESGSSTANPFIDRPKEEPLSRKVFRKRPPPLRIDPAGSRGIRPASPGRSRALSYVTDPRNRK